jgi:hypothetical protein
MPIARSKVVGMDRDESRDFYRLLKSAPSAAAESLR